MQWVGVMLEMYFGRDLSNPTTFFIGLALIGEGVMSALYHVCPSDINFQFGGFVLYISVHKCIK